MIIAPTAILTTGERLFAKGIHSLFFETNFVQQSSIRYQENLTAKRQLSGLLDYDGLME